MKNLDFNDLFEPNNESVLEFYKNSGVGYIIPDYQRNYSWDDENIAQLLSDISEGVDRLIKAKSKIEELHFLGTIITVCDKSIKNDEDRKGKPTRIDTIIDGQQRIITFSLMASVFIIALSKCLALITPTSTIYESVKKIVNEWNGELIHSISLDHSHGSPQLKPKVIREGFDYWTEDGDIEKAYQSAFAHYQALLIDSYEESPEKTVPNFQAKVLSGKYESNVKEIEKWVYNTVWRSHKEETEYPNAQQILNVLPEKTLWNCECLSFKNVVDDHFSGKKTDESDAICILVQTIAACYYFLKRCCVCKITPKHEDWAFDLFQSLNTTGTSLTALETFKPVMVNDHKTNNIKFNGSVSDKSFKLVQKTLDNNDNTIKSKRTNDFLVSFFVAYKGEKIPTHFSGERRALEDAYDNLSNAAEKESFIVQMGDYAQFFGKWLKYNGKKTFELDESNEGISLASMLIDFLKKSNHRMAITTLGSIYSNVLHKKYNAVSDFINTVKATAAFYFLWRSAYSNNGLDVVYRNYFQKCFNYKRPITVSSIKEHFAQALMEKVESKEEWKQKASSILKYGKSNNPFIKLALLITSTDTVPDPRKPGLLKPGKKDTFNCLTFNHWISENLNSIEHIAPQTNNSAWDNKLYDPDTMFVDSLGNLTLLPIVINSSLSNKGLQEKLLYYKCVAEEDQDNLDEITNKANELDITLSENTVALLRKSKYAHHLKPISELDYDDTWTAELVKDRTSVMLDIIWDTLIEWIS